MAVRTFVPALMKAIHSRSNRMINVKTTNRGSTCLQLAPTLQPQAAHRPKTNRFGMKTGVFLLLSLGLAAIECPAQSPAVPYDFSTIAGQLVGSDGFGGYANGTNGGAQFEYPFGIAVDLLGNLYVADSYNDVIRKMTHVGTNWVVTTLAGQPGVAGFGPSSTQSAVLFNEPRGVAVDGAGNVYVADTGNNLIREISTNGSVTTIGGGTTNAGYQDGNGLIAQFDYPLGIAVDNSLTITSGTVYVADTYNNAIRK